MADPEQGDNAFIVALDGILDVYRAAEVRGKLLLAASERRLIVDLSRARLLSAAILTELVHIYNERLAQGLEPTRFVVNSNAIHRVLDLTGLSKIWPIYPNLPIALSS